MEGSACNPRETRCEGGFRIEIQPDELIISRDRSAWNPRMARSRFWQTSGEIFVGLLLVVYLTSSKSGSGPVPLMSFPILMAILLFFLWPLGVNNIHCTREPLQVIVLRSISFPG
jgi:hypothetical protein